MRAARHDLTAVSVLLCFVLTSSAARAQGVGRQPPGPYVFDVRGTTLGVPQTSDFYPPDLPGDTIVPARGFGLEGGAHFYRWSAGPGRLGFGADFFWTRATATPTINSATATGTVTGIALRDVKVRMATLSPQLSMNFGSARGWSYLTIGGGGAWVRSEAGSGTMSRSVSDVNAGAGARWFLSNRVGVGFDLRVHWIGGSALFAASAGFSLK